MPLTLVETKAVTEIADALYSFLPGKPHPYADPKISFPGIALLLGVSDYWTGGSKGPAITALLSQTLEKRRDLFCRLVLEIVRRGLTYRANKDEQVTRKEVISLNESISKVGFKIPELWEPAFLDGLASDGEEPETEPEDPVTEGLSQLRLEFLELESMEGQARGYAFEKFLIGLFALFGLQPRSSFKLVGEQIDGSLVLEGAIYLIEARWQQDQVNNANLLVFQEKVTGKSTWSRGLFVSYSGFTLEGQEAFSRGRSTSIIGMTGQDLYFILDGKMSLVEAIRMKSRRAAETGRFLVTVQELLLESPR